MSSIRRKLSLQLRFLTERSKLHATKKAAQRAAGIVREKFVAKVEAEFQRHPRSHGQEPHPNGQEDCRSRRPSTKDAQEIIQFEHVDFEQVVEKRQAASQAKKSTNRAKQIGVSKNTQHNVK